MQEGKLRRMRRKDRIEKRKNNKMQKWKKSREDVVNCLIWKIRFLSAIKDDYYFKNILSSAK